MKKYARNCYHSEDNCYEKKQQKNKERLQDYDWYYYKNIFDDEREERKQYEKIAKSLSKNEKQTLKEYWIKCYEKLREK